MNRDQLRHIPVAALTAFATAWGAVGCLTTAFDLPLRSPWSPALVCGLCALVSSLLLSRRGGTLLLCLLALTAGYVCREGTASAQLLGLITHLAAVYDRAYGWGVPSFSGISAGNVDWPLCIWGGLIALSVSWCICRQRTVWLVAAALLPLAACIVVTDTVPGEACLIAVMAGLLLLVLTASVRKEDALQADRLLAAAALPVLLALAALFALVPQKDYVNHSAILRSNLLAVAENIPRLIETGTAPASSGLKPQPSRQVDLSKLGDRLTVTYPVMEVTAEQSGTLYLRGQDYDVYDGHSWTASEARTETFGSAGGPRETIRIRTRTRKAIQYLPYHPAQAAVLQGGCAENPGEVREYTIARDTLPENWRLTAYGGSRSDAGDQAAYLVLPEATRQNARVLLEHLYNRDLSNTAKADIIAALVIDSAGYDTHPKKMPTWEGDFALWFLREGETGYCVHFATAATVLLRAAGIPARYVTGYMAEAEAGETVLVTEENAHAWAEYYEPNLGVWLPLEVTPAASAPAQTRPAVTQATDPTRNTEPLSQTTAPSEPISAELPPQAEAPAEQTAPWHLLLLLLAGAALLPVQRRLRLWLRRRSFHRGDPRQQALRRWQEAVWLARLLKESPTEELIVLAQKAKFSQHQLIPEELQQFDSFHRSCLRRLKSRPWYLRLIYKYIYAVC